MAGLKKATKQCHYPSSFPSHCLPIHLIIHWYAQIIPICLPTCL